jgi:hypothetical protein
MRVWKEEGKKDFQDSPNAASDGVFGTSAWDRFAALLHTAHLPLQESSALAKVPSHGDSGNTSCLSTLNIMLLGAVGTGCFCMAGGLQVSFSGASEELKEQRPLGGGVQDLEWPGATEELQAHLMALSMPHIPHTSWDVSFRKITLWTDTACLM